MKVRVIGHNKKPFLPPTRNNPWHAFFNYIKNNGGILVSGPSGEKFDALIANSHSRKAIRECVKYGVSKNNRILILWESKEVNGKLYKISTFSNYGHIFSLSRGWSKNSSTHNFKWPQGRAKLLRQTEKKWLSRKNKFVFIGSNKYSVSRGELYSLRRVILRNTKSKKFIDLFGHGWDKSFIYDFKDVVSSLIKTNYKNYSINSIRLFARKYTNYQGISLNKNDTLNKYKFALIIENSTEYISEKLFEALENECIVLYVGGNLKENDLNKNIAIQASTNTADVFDKLNKILNLSNKEHLVLLKRQQKEYLKIVEEWNNYKILGQIARESMQVLNFKHIPPRQF